ncbi:HK97 gp10 family phage protein [Rhizomonospora bruguierae]|uniref:HK97 gp10 family phage protein n=1 Tax=Rhizomonospora bruguierae TaxID=1581705 RepID=UPI001BCF4382|nr:HK97 gp10 family phage protein [Micromonospora sp. NBRC 107566]
MPAARLEPTAIVRIEAASVPTVRRLIVAIAADMRAGVPVDNGDLLRSIHEEYPKAGRPVGRVHVGGPGADHWASVEYGSQPHEIRSHGPWPLRNRKTGQVFGRRVWHPGTPAQPFARPAIYRARALGLGMP